jgi:hypothetical protein
MVLKIVLEAGHDTYTGENRPVAENRRRKSTIGREEKLDRNYDGFQDNIYYLKLVSVLKEASRNFLFFYSVKRHSKI